jgi:hypothetical protein
MGRHIQFIESPHMENLMHWQYYHSWIVVVGVSLVKVSIAFFLLRLVSGRKYRWFLKGVIGKPDYSLRLADKRIRELICSNFSFSGYFHLSMCIHCYIYVHTYCSILGSDHRAHREMSEP